MGFLKKFFSTPTPPVLKAVPEPNTTPPEDLEPEPVPIFYKSKKLPTTDKANPDKRILAIEAQALALGWTGNQLFLHCKRPDLRGLASIIQPEQVITTITRQYIQLERVSPTGKLEIQRFYNHNVDQPWLKKPSP